MPGSVSAGMPEKKASNAASPPADAPMPTTGHPGASCPDGGSTATRFEGSFRLLRLAPFCRHDDLLPFPATLASGLC